MSIDYELLASVLARDGVALVQRWLPEGRRVGREWKVGSLKGEAGNSLGVNLDSFRWSDFTTGDKGGDLISLFAAINGMSQAEAAKALGGDEYEKRDHRNNGAAGRPAPPDRTAPQQKPEPPPAEKPPGHAPLTPPTFAHPRHGAPAHVYPYRDHAGDVLYVVARYESSEGKQFCPWTWRDGRWRPKGPDKPRPLYGLNRFKDRPRRAIVVEGEKAADALQGVVQLSPVVTWSGGATNWRYADWQPLTGRPVLLWPDADPPGIEAAQGIAAELIKRGCQVTVVDVEGLADGYDAADAVAAGLVGTALNEWLKPRLKPVAVLQRQEPQRAAEPEPVAQTAVTVPAKAESPPPEKRRPSGYQVAQQFGLKLGPRGVFQNMSNVGLMIDGLIQQGEIPPIWWDAFLRQIRTGGEEWADRHTLKLLAILQRAYEFEKISRSTVDEAVGLYAWEHQKNCAVEWLEGLTWDGTARLDTLLPLGFGTDRNVYTAAVGRCFIMGMVARVLMPGCQVDNLPVFEGVQGISKTRAMRAIGGNYFAEITEPVTSKDFYLSLAGKMLVEISEFSSFKKQEDEAIRGAITRTVDRFRAPYERRPSDHPRSCVFSATTNEKNWNRDPTGARRFWPVRCGAVSVAYVSEAREQLFAEAVARVRRVPDTADPRTRIEAEAAWWDVPADDAKREQDARYDGDSIAPDMQHFVETRDGFTTLEVITFGLGIDKEQRFDQRLARRVDAMLVHWGYGSALDKGVKVWRKIKPAGA